MSTDLHLRSEILQIRLPPINTSTSLPPSDANSSTTPTEKTVNTISSDADAVECHTPKSPRNMIPKMLNCPPPPRKQRRPAASCKRKLEFFEDVAREEVESFFRSSFQRIDSQIVKKRRCKCI